MTGADGQRSEAYGRAQQANLYSGTQNIYFGSSERRAASVPLAVPEREFSSDRLRGRGPLLERLAGDERVIVLHGVGGSGKTTLAIELAHRAAERHGARAWRVQADDRASLDAGMTSLAYALGATEDAIRHEHVAEVVWRALNALAEPWLLIIDNADDRSLFSMDGTGYLRRPELPHGTVVVTSRDDRWPAWTRLELVDVLAPADGARVLLDRAPDAGSAEDAEALSGWLGNLPLALDLAGSYLAAAGEALFPPPDAVTTFAGYLSTFDTRLTELADGLATGDTAKRRTILTTWELSLDLLADQGQPLARPLLRLLASFGQAPIPYGLLLSPGLLAESELFGGAVEHGNLDAALRDLQRLRLVTIAVPADRDRQRYSARLHPLVRDAARYNIHAAGESADYEALVATLLRTAVFSQPAVPLKDPRTWPTWQLLTPHALEALSGLATGPTLHRRAAPDCLFAADLAARFLRTQGKFESAHTVYSTIIPIATDLFGPGDLKTLDYRYSFALTLHDEGQPALAEIEYRDVLAGRLRAVGPNHPAVLATRQNLARTLRDQGHADLAEQQYRDILARRLRKYSPDHPAVLATRQGLASTLYDQGHLEQAERQYRDILAGRLHRFGPNHPDTLMTQDELAQVLHTLGRTDEAKRMVAEVVRRKIQILGRDHPHTQLSQRRLRAWNDD